MCNCEYCIPCEFCGHQADEHIAGNGQCFKCKCPKYANKIAEAWDNLNLLQKQSFPSFEDFVNQWCIGDNK